MEWAKKHIALIITIVLIIALILPLGINALYLISTDCEVLHKPSEWTMFWGGYLGAIISAAVAFIILHIQRKENDKQNDTNRNIQINTIKYQQELSRLDNFITTASKLIEAINPIALKTLCKQIQRDNVSQIEKALLDSIDYVLRVQRELCLHLSDMNVRQKQLGEDIDKIIDRFTDIQCDIQNFLIMISVSDVPMTNQLLKEYATDNDEMSERLKKAILDFTPSKYEGVKLEWEWESIILSLADLVQDESDKLYELIDSFVEEERTRINKILTERI